MAYDEHLADRIRQSFQEKRTEVVEKNMMGGLCFMLNEKMCCGIHFDKKRQIDLLMARIGEEAYVEAIERTGCHPMDFTGRAMKGYVFVDENGFDSDDDLNQWIQLAIDFNPLAKASVKRKKK
jgi:TfoX/Sxy family transcriptional regulator of competence genes